MVLLRGAPLTENLSVTDLLAQRLVASPHAVAQSVGEETVLLHVPSERFVSLDDVASAMWTAALAAPSLDHAVDALLLEFDVDRTTLATDLTAFVTQLVELELASLQPAA